MRHPRPPRPRLPRPRLHRPKLARPRLPGDAGFRIRTRILAGGYWLREKAGIAGWAAGRAAGVVGDAWFRRSRSTRHVSLVAAGVLALYAVVKLAPVAGIPCQISAARECPPGDDAVALVPANALLYAHLTLDRDTTQFRRAENLVAKVRALKSLPQALADSLPTPGGEGLDLGSVGSWVGDEAALAAVPVAGGRTELVYLLSVDDRAGADRFVAEAAPGMPHAEQEGDAAIEARPGGLATAFVGDFLLLGAEGAVRASLAARAEGDTLEREAAAARARDQLPDARLAELYLSRPGIKALLSPRAPGSSQLEVLVDYGASSGIAAAVVAEEGGISLELVSILDPDLITRSPSLFAELPSFEPGLADEMGPRTLGYVGVGDLGPTLGALVSQARRSEPALGRSLSRLIASLRREAGVDSLAGLLPALGGQAALVAEPTDAFPFASLIVDGVDEERAKPALERLERPLLRSLRLPGGRAPAFDEIDVDGVPARSVEISSQVRLTYAFVGDKLVISTDPAGIAQVRASATSLGDSDAYTDAVDSLPDSVSALVFLNLDELLALAERAGLAEDPLYASFRDDISRLRSAGLGVVGSDEMIESKLFVVVE